MVFASLVEYAVVSYMNKKLAQRRERRRKQAEQQMPIEMPMYSQISPSPKPKMVSHIKLIFLTYVKTLQSKIRTVVLMIGCTFISVISEYDFDQS